MKARVPVWLRVILTSPILLGAVVWTTVELLAFLATEFGKAVRGMCRDAYDFVWRD